MVTEPDACQPPTLLYVTQAAIDIRIRQAFIEIHQKTYFNTAIAHGHDKKGGTG